MSKHILFVIDSPELVNISDIVSENTCIDVIDSSRTKSKIVKRLASHAASETTIVFRTSLDKACDLLKLVLMMPKRFHIVYWAIDASFINSVTSADDKYLRLIDMFVVADRNAKLYLSELGYNNSWWEPSRSISAIQLDVLTCREKNSWWNNLRRCLKNTKWIYFTRYKLIDKDYKNQKKALFATSVKTPNEIRYEMAECRKYWHCPPTQYVRYGLYGKRISIEDILDYIPAFEFYNHFMRMRLDGVNQKLFGNKLFLYHIFKQYDIPTPPVIAVVRNGSVTDANRNPIAIDILKDLLTGNDKYFFKPTNGAGGTGIKVFKPSDILNIFLNSLEQNTEYVIQRGIKQRDDFSAINDSSVNTLRIITQYTANGPEMKACVLRIGRNGKDVDNSHQGGMSCQIDITDGSLTEMATAEHGGGNYYSHPDTGFVFKKEKISGWFAIKNAVLLYASCFPELKELGWDIAVTNEGIQAIEMNLGYGIDHLQVSCGGMRRKLGVYPTVRNSAKGGGK